MQRIIFSRRSSIWPTRDENQIRSQAPPCKWLYLSQNNEQISYSNSIYIHIPTSNSKIRPHPSLNQRYTVLKFTCNFFINSVYINRLFRCTNSLLNRVIIKKVRQPGEKSESIKRTNRNDGTSHPFSWHRNKASDRKKHTHRRKTNKKKVLVKSEK